MNDAALPACETSVLPSSASAADAAEVAAGNAARLGRRALGRDVHAAAEHLHLRQPERAFPAGQQDADVAAGDGHRAQRREACSASTTRAGYSARFNAVVVDEPHAVDEIDAMPGRRGRQLPGPVEAAVGLHERGPRCPTRGVGAAVHRQALELRPATPASDAASPRQQQRAEVARRRRRSRAVRQHALMAPSNSFTTGTSAGARQAVKRLGSIAGARRRAGSAARDTPARCAAAPSARPA